MIVLDRHDALDLELYRRVASGGEEVLPTPDVLRAVDERREAMLRALDAGVPAYGVTTGLGYMSRHAVEPADRYALQRSILLGRSVAVGEPLPAEVVRGTMLLRLTAFLSGDAGVSSELCRLLAARLNDGWTPWVPAGPHGSSGEVVPLAHLFSTFVGEGFVLENGERVPAASALAARGQDPYVPGLKEGIALVNGAPLAPALAIHLVERARSLLDHATLAAALTVALTGASSRPLSTRIGRLKGDPGQLTVHARLFELLGGGDWEDRPQAPVSLRVVPQVHGAVLDVLATAEHQLEREVKAVTDSPLYLPALGVEPEGFYPSGNFHAQALAFELDFLAIAFAQVASLAEKRLHRLLDARFSELPEQLAERPGIHTGAAVLHKAVIALGAENRLLAAPVSAGSADTSAGQEDFQAFEFLAADKLRRLLDNMELGLAYELVALRQARSLRGGSLPVALERACELLGDAVEPLGEDRPLAPDVERVRDLVRSGRLLG
ncbi:MAG TPA: aromatic amino acid lyase [Gaiellaceae bacterium]